MNLTIITMRQLLNFKQMNIFLKFLAVTLGSLILVAGVAQLQLIAFELMNAADTFDFYLGLFYLAVVVFIWGSTIYFTVNYLKDLTTKKVSKEEQDEQVTNNN